MLLHPVLLPHVHPHAVEPLAGSDALVVALLAFVGALLLVLQRGKKDAR